ncbi:MAG: peptidoglycan DD-metalloendopeptidase family protein [Pseudomonadota bacterium]
MRNHMSSSGKRRFLLITSAIVVSASLAGCSAGVERFDLSNYSYSDGDKTSTAGVDRPDASRGGAGFRNAGYDDRRANESVAPRRLPKPGPSYAGSPPPAAPDRISRLPDPRPVQPVGTPQRRPFASARANVRRTRTTNPVRTAALTPTAAPASGTITVASGDTLYGLSRRHRVSVRALMQANGLTSPSIRVGQRLRLPGTARPANTAVRPAPRPRSSGVSAPRQTVRYGAQPQRGTVARGSYLVQRGDSLYSIARTHRVSVSALMDANGITDARSLRAGQRLRLPGQRGPAVRPIAARDAQPVRTAPRRFGGPRIIGRRDGRQPTVRADRPRKVKVATVRPRTTPTRRATRTRPAPIALQPAPRSSASKFRWPATGRIISKFGPRRDGTHNDGINIAVPMNTPVQAAENGVVAYAGDELRGYGNLILIRHADNWVTAYAHNAEMMVKRGDKVKRGDVIAKAGKTGTVDRPQVHFELRKGSKPVNPRPYLR